jgi:hypothetical protein
VKVVTRAEPLFDEVSQAFYAAAEEVRDEAAANVRAAKSHNPETGSLADTMKMWKRKRKDRPTATVGSRKSEYVTIMEFGGGPAAGWDAAGPHVKRANAPRFIRRALESFPGRYEARLKGARSSTYMYDPGRTPFHEAHGTMVGR